MMEFAPGALLELLLLQLQDSTWDVKRREYLVRDLGQCLSLQVVLRSA